MLSVMWLSSILMVSVEAMLSVMWLSSEVWVHVVVMTSWQRSVTVVSSNTSTTVWHTFLGVSTVLGTHSLTGVRVQAGALTCPTVVRPTRPTVRPTATVLPRPTLLPREKRRRAASGSALGAAATRQAPRRTMANFIFELLLCLSATTQVLPRPTLLP